MISADLKSVSQTDSTQFNIAQYLPEMALSAPDRAAVICAHQKDRLGRTALTFAELNSESDACAYGLHTLGLKPGMRTLLMVRPGLEFVTLTFALFKAGAVPVLIDPGMGGKNLLNCIRRSQPEAMVAIPLVHALKSFVSDDVFKSLKLSVTAGSRWFWSGPTLELVFRRGAGAKPFIAPTTRSSDAAILFTTGSTGIPKGVCYQHGMFDAQVQAIRAQYGIAAGEVDLPAFPLFALFSTALGTTCVIPEMDPTRPARCNPAKIVAALQKHQITYTFGSPAIWKRVGPYLKANKIILPQLQRILMAGAPVKGHVLEPFIEALPNGDTFIPYGATEALPVSSMRGSDVVRETWALTKHGYGHCVGRPLPGVTVKIIRESQEKTPWDDKVFWDEKLVLPQGQIGEIVVTSAMVTHEYFQMPEETRRAKMYETISETDALGNKTERQPLYRVWHRMGDMGYIDPTGRIWFCGRKAHRVILSNKKVLYSVCVEAVFEAFLEKFLTDKKLFPEGVRVALVGVGGAGSEEKRAAFIVLEVPGASRWKTFKPAPAVLDALINWQRTKPLAQDITGVLWYPKNFPVDIRHNAKINREKLALWATAQVNQC
jgi:acyl-CoA synthetase (AMP-forming)/AMP-acid ligase II